MLKRNLISLLIHLTVGLIIFYSYCFIGITLGNFESKLFGLTFTIISLVLYSYLTYRLLEPRSKLLDNLLCNVLAPILSLIIWIGTILFFSASTLQMGENIYWIPFYIFNSYIFPAIISFNVNNALYIIPFIIVPSIINLLTLELKKLYLKNKK